MLTLPVTPAPAIPLAVDAAVEDLRAEESVVYRFDEDDHTETLTISPDGMHWAMVRKVATGEIVLRDGVPGTVYGGIARDSLRWSADGRHLMYVATREEEPLFAADVDAANRTGHTSWTTSAGRTVLVVVDGKEIDGYDAIDQNNLALSDDGAHHAFVGRKSGRWWVVHDGVATGGDHTDVAPYPDKPGLRMSADGKRLAYVAVRAFGDPENRRLRWRVVSEGAPGTEFDAIIGGSLALSADGAHVAYMANRGGQPRVVHDGVEGKGYPNILWHSRVDPPLTMSPDGRRVAYTAQVHGVDGVVLVVDGVEGKSHPRIIAPTFSPDSRRLAYLSIGRVVGNAGVDMALVLDGKVGRSYLQLKSPPQFSPDGTRVVIVNLPLRRRLESSRESVVIDGKEGPEFREIVGAVRFGPDGKRYAYLAVDWNNKGHVVTDRGEYTGKFDFPKGTRVVFGKDEVLSVLVQRGDTLVRVALAAR